MSCYIGYDPEKAARAAIMDIVGGQLDAEMIAEARSHGYMTDSERRYNCPSCGQKSALLFMKNRKPTVAACACGFRKTDGSGKNGVATSE